ncbi:MAG: M20 family metallopeptidase [Bacillota bacterium]|jgi:acetylornithine deacetylase/succinyl-diaminopimelate desuccinylase
MDRDHVARALACLDEGELMWLSQKLISIPSYHGLEDPEKDVAEFARDYLKSNGVSAEKVDVLGCRGNVIAALGDNTGGSTLMLNGHLDTVGVENMTIDPFEGFSKDGNIYGRGAVDMKGAVAAMIMAMVCLRRSGARLTGRVLFTGVIDEEWWSEGTRHLVKNGPRARYAIVGEPTGNEIHTGHRGLEWLEVKVHGKYAHGGTPERGINAITKMSKVIIAINEKLLPDLRTRLNPITGPATCNLGFIKGGTQPSTVAGDCLLQMDRRWIPGESTRSVMDEIEGLLNGIAAKDPEFKASVNNMRDMEANEIGHPPLCTPDSSLLVAAMKDACRFVLGGCEISRFPAWTDAGILSSVGEIETVVFGPGDLACAHSEVEYCPVDSIVQSCKVYIATAISLCT